MKKIFLAIASVAFLASCGNDATDNSATSTPAANNAPTPAPTQAPAGQPAAVNVQPQAAPAPDPNVKDPNPAHGQPGHRCDIPVGASLSSAPAAPKGGAQPQQIQVNPQAAPAKK